MLQSILVTWTTEATFASAQGRAEMADTYRGGAHFPNNKSCGLGAEAGHWFDRQGRIFSWWLPAIRFLSFVAF